MSSADHSQVEYWNGEGGEHWAAFHGRYDELLAGFGDVVIDRADPQPGQRFADVGCGAGATTLAVATRVAPDGDAIGIDLSKPLIDIARRHAHTSGVDNVRFEAADAAQFAFEPGPLDGIVSRFGVMFFADPVAAFSRFRTALRPSGRLCFVCWQSPLDNEWITVPGAAIVEHLTMPPIDADGPGLFSLSNPTVIRSNLYEAGFESVQIEPLLLPQRFGVDIEDAVGFMTRTQVAARLLGQVDATQRAVATDSLRRALAPHADTDGVYLTGAAWLVDARTSQ